MKWNFCPYCGHRFGEEDNYCAKCGQSRQCHITGLIGGNGAWHTSTVWVGGNWPSESTMTVTHAGDIKLETAGGIVTGYTSERQG